ncbi:MAG TPA: IS91 family transposase [Phycisphaerae bacterium]|nr:IS91 family transposase [Phycisphaerae bacterium]
MPGAVPASTVPAEASSCELADVFRRYGEAYQSTHLLTPAQRKAMWAITHCRTAALGGHREWCPACGFERYTYHSCRNRHCPKCQTTATAAWVAARREELLPVPYFHDVFTLPHEFNGLILYSPRNQRALLGLLFAAVAQTLLTFGRNDLGGKVGFTLVLHTWDQQLRAHFHLHCLIASGALADDGSRWIAGGRQFLFPVRGLSKMFRAKYLDGLAQLLQADQLDVPPSLAELAAADTRRRWLRRLRKKPWVVYSQAPFAGPRKLLDYLGRYTHRVAISNHRLLDCRDGQVRYRYRDRRDGDRLKTDLLPAEEFIHRFLKHVLPDRFLRIRHYGLLANRVKQKLLARCRQLLGVRPPAAADEEPSTAADWIRVLLGIEITQCPRCGQPLHRQVLRPSHGPPAHPSLPPHPHGFPPWDTS